MKTALITILILGLAVSAFAIDFQTVSDASVKVFLEVFPQYQALLQKYGQEVDATAPIPLAEKYTQEIQNLLGKYGIKMEDFPVLMQKITTGFAQAQMDQSGMGAMFGNMMAQAGAKLAPQEMEVIKKYFPQIEQVLSAE